MSDTSNTPLGYTAAEANPIVNLNSTGTDKVGVFTSAQSLVTFPGATFAVSLIWSVLEKVYPPFGTKNLLVPLVLSVAIGSLIYLSSVQQGGGVRGHIMGGFVALVNSFIIAAAVLGVSGTQGKPVANDPVIANTVQNPVPASKDDLLKQAEDAAASENYALAIEKYNSLIKLESENSWHYKDRGNAFQHLRTPNFEAAVADYNTALGLIPRFDDASLNQMMPKH